MKKILWFVVVMLYVPLATAQSSGPINTPQLNKAYFFVGTSPYNTTIQSAVTAACAATAHSGQVIVPPGVSPTDGPTAATGCAGVTIVVQASVTTCYTWGSAGPYTSSACVAGVSGGTVTSFSSGNLAPLFTTSVATATTTPVQTYTPATAAQNAVLAGPTAGGTGAYSFRALVTGDLPTGIPFANLGTMSANSVLGALTATTPSALAMPTCNGTTNALTWTTGAGFGCNSLTPGSGTVTSVGLSMPTYFSISGSPITTNGTLTVTGTSESANFFLAAPNGSTGAMTPRAIVGADLPAATTSVQGAVILPAGASSNTLGTAAILTATGGLTYAATVANSGFSANEIATFTGTGGGIGGTGIYAPATLIPSSGMSFLQIASNGVMSSIAGITASCPGPSCGVQQINFAPCSTTTSLSSSITSSQTTIPVTSTSCLSPSGVVALFLSGGSTGEYVAYTSISGSTLMGVTRGYWGTPPASLTSSTSVVDQVNIGYSLSSTSIPYYTVYQNNATNYNQNNNLGCIAANCVEYGAVAMFAAGFASTGAISSISTNSSGLFFQTLTLTNSYTGGSCAMAAIRIGANGSSTNVWDIGDTNANCTTGADNGAGPNTLYLRFNNTGPVGVTWTSASGIVSQTTTGAQTAAGFNPTSAQTTVSCSTSGTAVFSQTMQGSSQKVAIITLSACLGTASYTFPTAYTAAPSPYGTSGLTSLASSVSTTAVTVTGTTSTGTFGLVGY
jgi:hypothetical protein